MTRFGMKEDATVEAVKLAVRGERGEDVRSEVIDFRSNFTDLRFTVPEEIWRPWVEKMQAAYSK